jgi:hypothetical protein
MPISVQFTAHRTVRVTCGDETIEVPFPDARQPTHHVAIPAYRRPATAPVASSGPAAPVRRPPVIALVQSDDARHALAPEVLARAMDQPIACSPVHLADVEDFNVTQLSVCALEDDVRDAADAREQPLVLDVLGDPAGLDDAIAMERLRRIVNDRSNPIDAIRLLGPVGAD